MPYRIVTTSYQQDQAGIQAVRRRVFIDEQGIDPAEEWDTYDVSAIFSIALDDRDQAIGTARLINDGRIGRMAVLPEYRRQGVGTAILRHLLSIARQQGYTRIRLSAQQSVIAFYTRQGFQPFGPPHEEVGIPHQNMQLML